MYEATKQGTLIATCALMFATPHLADAGDHPPVDRILVVATPQHSSSTGWSRNWCNDGRFEAGAGFSCADGGLSLGGEVYKVRLANIRVISGRLPPSVRYIGLPGHALRVPSHNRTPWALILTAAPPHFSAETGLSYFAMDYGQFHSSVACLSAPIGATLGIPEPHTATDPDEPTWHNCYSLATILRLRP